MSTINLLSLPTEIIIHVIAAGKHTGHGYFPRRHPDGLLLTSLRAACRRLRWLIDDNWGTLVDVFSEHIVNSRYSTEEYYFCGLRHRVGGPAYISEDHVAWWSYGQRHRGGDLPAVICDEVIEWWYAGQCHRDGDLPAVYKDLGWAWYKYGKKTRGGVSSANEPQSEVIQRGDLPTSVNPTAPFDTIAARAAWDWYSDPSEPCWRGTGTYDWTQSSTLTARLPAPAKMNPCVLVWREGSRFIKSIVID